MVQGSEDLSVGVPHYALCEVHSRKPVTSLYRYWWHLFFSFRFGEGFPFRSPGPQIAIPTLSHDRPSVHRQHVVTSEA